MEKNLSPWVDQLKNKNKVFKLSESLKTDVLVIGGGISGVLSSYFLLKNTNLKITLIEAKTIASGATGHNAGQLVSYFEKQIVNMVKEFGYELAISAQKDINSTWFLLEEIFQETSINTKISIFTGYAGIQTYEDLLIHLQNTLIYKKGGLIYEKLSISSDSPYLNKIPKKYHNLFSLISKKNLLDYLETKDGSYQAMISTKKGVMNSAEFCEDMVEYCLNKYQDRFIIREHSPVSDLYLKENNCLAIVENYKILSKKVILCTNGFEKMNIINLNGKDINKKFHQIVKGCIGYMSAYLEEDLREPTAVSFLPKESNTGNDSYDSNPYFYFTRRDYEEKNKRYNLICLGGPEALLDDTNNYNKEHPYPQEAIESIDEFIHKTYKYSPKGEINYKYQWHGLMGYTPNGVRLVGEEPLNKNLIYNLGCNGIGILPAIFGSKKVSLIIKGEKFPKSIFDPVTIPQN